MLFSILSADEKKTKGNIGKYFQEMSDVIKLNFPGDIREIFPAEPGGLNLPDTNFIYNVSLLEDKIRIYRASQKNFLS